MAAIHHHKAFKPYLHTVTKEELDDLIVAPIQVKDFTLSEYRVGMRGTKLTDRANHLRWQEYKDMLL